MPRSSNQDTTDRFSGWAAEQRQKNLALVVNNVRFLILPWAKVPQLGSWILGQVTGRIAQDWQTKYGHPVVLLETFVERERFRGTVYWFPMLTPRTPSGQAGLNPRNRGCKCGIGFGCCPRCHNLARRPPPGAQGRHARLPKQHDQLDQLRLLWKRVAGNLADEWTLARLAREAGYSNEHLRRLCRRQFGRSPMHRVTYLRMLRAAGLLATHEQTIEAITLEVGYHNPFGFSNA